MDSGKIENQEMQQAQSEIVDIYNRRFKIHWAEIKNLPKILRRGLYSPAFARRVGDVDYEARGSSADENEVHLTFLPHFMWGHEVGKAVGIVVKAPVDEVRDRSTRFRISPPQSVGLVVADTLPVRTYNSRLKEIKETIDAAKPMVLRRVRNIRRVLESEGLVSNGLPIYGITGGLYLPSRMSHSEIVQMLRQKEGQSLMAKD